MFKIILAVFLFSSHSMAADQYVCAQLVNVSTVSIVNYGLQVTGLLDGKEGIVSVRDDNGGGSSMIQGCLSIASQGMQSRTKSVLLCGTSSFNENGIYKSILFKTSDQVFSCSLINY